jgi:hypothetical protein
MPSKNTVDFWSVGLPAILTVILCVSVIALIAEGVGVAMQDICELQLRNVTTLADSTAIIEQSQPWYYPKQWKCKVP